MRVLRALAGTSGVLVLAVCVVLTLGHAGVLTGQPGAIAATVAPGALVGYPIGAGLCLLASRGPSVRWRRLLGTLAAVGVAGAVLHAVWLAPYYVGPRASGPVRLSVMTLNLRLGYGDAAQAVALARSTRVQVVVLEEVTTYEESALEQAGLRRFLPYRVGRAGPDASGTVVYSAYRLTDTRPVAVQHHGVVTTVAAPHPFRLIAVHTAQPLTAIGRWTSDHALLNRLARTTTGPLMMAGDFNATMDHPAMRELAGAGLHDAAMSANSGYQPTWPGAVTQHGFPSAVAIDHVLTRDTYRPLSTSTVLVAGTDHRALIVRLAAPAN